LLQAAAKALDGAAEWMADMDATKNEVMQQLLTKEEQLDELVRLLQEQEQDRLSLKMELESAQSKSRDDGSFGSMDLADMPMIAADEEGTKLQLQAKSAEVAALKLATKQRKAQLEQSRAEAKRLMVRTRSALALLLLSRRIMISNT
jgi:hypothetical protein